MCRAIFHGNPLWSIGPTVFEEQVHLKSLPVHLSYEAIRHNNIIDTTKQQKFGIIAEIRFRARKFGLYIASNAKIWYNNRKSGYYPLRGAL